MKSHCAMDDSEDRRTIDMYTNGCHLILLKQILFTSHTDMAHVMQYKHSAQLLYDGTIYP